MKHYLIFAILLVSVLFVSVEMSPRGGFNWKEPESEHRKFEKKVRITLEYAHSNEINHLRYEYSLVPVVNYPKPANKMTLSQHCEQGFTLRLKWPPIFVAGPLNDNAMLNLYTMSGYNIVTML